MTKQVTVTKVKIAKIIIENGKPKVLPMKDEILLGNVNKDKAHKIIDKRYDCKVVVLDLQTDTKIYEMEVEEFIKVAKLKDK